MPDGKVRAREVFLTFDQAFIATFSSSTVRKKIKENAWSLILPFYTIVTKCTCQRRQILKCSDDTEMTE